MMESRLEAALRIIKSFCASKGLAPRDLLNDRGNFDEVKDVISTMLETRFGDNDLAAALTKLS